MNKSTTPIHEAYFQQVLFKKVNPKAQRPLKNIIAHILLFSDPLLFAYPFRCNR